MTPNKRLREKVARGIAERALCADNWRDYLNEADIAIRIVIDEVRERLGEVLGE